MEVCHEGSRNMTMWLRGSPLAYQARTPNRSRLLPWPPMTTRPLRYGALQRKLWKWCCSKRSYEAANLNHKTINYKQVCSQSNGRMHLWKRRTDASSNNPHNNQSSISDCDQPVSTSTEATSSAILARPTALTMWHTALVRPTWAPIRRESMSKDQRGRIHDNLDGTPNNQSE